ncbi:lamin tail domain-containing protein [Streptomyces sp. NPDC058295]|uniref:lamin tail domain-containing protein n=1 Tax=Streptomyces sp. NPDC058295 TaxID=3346431 RepID=UPI0036E2FAA7
MSASASFTARRLAAAALVAGALVSVAALPATAADHARPHRAQVEISAVQHGSTGREDHSNRSLNRERAQLTNPTRHAISLDGWTLSDEDGHTYTFHHYRLAPQSTVRVHTGKGRDTHGDRYQNRRTYVWDDDRDTVTLRDNRGRTVDDYSWGHRRGGRH